MQSASLNLATFFLSRVKKIPNTSREVKEEEAVVAEVPAVAVAPELVVVITTTAEVAESRNSDLTTSPLLSEPL